MIKTFVAFTQELDDVDAGIAQLLAELDLDGRLQAHSIGRVSCYNAYVTEGFCAALSQALPFTVLGGSTLSLANNCGTGIIALSIMVLTSNDVQFITGASPQMYEYEDIDPAIGQLCREMFSNPNQQPSLLLPIMPFVLGLGGDEIIDAINKHLPGVPAFGTLAFSDEPDFSQ